MANAVRTFARVIASADCSRPRHGLDAVRAIKRLCLIAVSCALFAAFASPASALECDGISLDGGCLFTVTGGDTPDPDDGFAVTNAYGVPLWDFVKSRNLEALGYPISQRWIDGPFTLQAFQKVILQWDPAKGRMNFYNTLDVLANRYAEVELPFVPAHQVLQEDHGADFQTITRNHLALLEQNAAIKERFLSEPDWLNLYGLPISYEELEVDGNPQGVQMLRAQRTVFVVWNVPAPGTTVGRVNLQNVPDKVKKLSNVIIPDSCLSPVDESNPEVLTTRVRSTIESLPWVSPNGSTQENDAKARLETIAETSPVIFWYVVRDMDLPWTGGSISGNPLGNRPTAATVAALDLLIDIGKLSWIQDGIAETEYIAFRILSDSSFIWPAFVEALLQRSWLSDGISQDETRVLDRTFSSLFSLTLYPGNPTRLGLDYGAACSDALYGHNRRI